MIIDYFEDDLNYFLVSFPTMNIVNNFMLRNLNDNVILLASFSYTSSINELQTRSQGPIDSLPFIMAKPLER